MRTLIILSSVVVLGWAIALGFDGIGLAKNAPQATAQRGTKVAPKPSENPSAKPIEKPADKTIAKPLAKSPVAAPVPQKRSADEQAIRQTNDSFVKAFGLGNANSAAAHFTAGAEYVDESGNLFQGRQAIEESLAEFFKENPGCKLEMNVATIRFIGPGVAVEDGSTTVTRPNGPESADSRYTTVHVKTDGKWLAASVRDHAPQDRRQHRVHLRQLEWLVGDWVDEGDHSLVTFACRPVESGNFLLREFNILIAGQEAMSGTQRIGWDPLTGKLRAWIFDSEGGYSDGYWHRDGESWVLKSTGVTADGQTASSTSIYKFVNAHTMTWQSVHHEIAGVQQPDSEVVTIVRRAPVPLEGLAEDHK